MRKPFVAVALIVFALLGLTRADPVINKIDQNDQIRLAINELFERIPGMTCEESENWSVAGDLEASADFLQSELDSRGWMVLDHGRLEHSYAVIADPDPGDDRAVAVAGLIEDAATSSFVFLERCTLPE